MKIAKKLKNWVKEHKIESCCLIGGTIIVASGAILFKKHKGKFTCSDLFNLSTLQNWKIKPASLANMGGLKVPEMAGEMECLDICKDGENGFIIWLKDCKISDMGKLGEGISKIEGLTPGTTATMVTLWDYTKE